MTSDEKQDCIDELFTQAVALLPSERGAFLDQACGADPDGVRAEVERLLRVDHELQGQAHEFLRSPPFNIAAVLAAPSHHALQPGVRIGPYQVKTLIGEGGFGDVYLAARVDAYEQDVAIKIARWKADQHSQLLARFEQERQVLADLNHEHIARLLGGGSTEEGRPYLVMEYVLGTPITEYCARQALDVACRLALFQTVCRAVAYAHRHGVIHRDLKPSNILVTKDGAPKLIDFGIARLTGPASHHRRLATTQMSLLPLTPEYASPEQVRGERATTESDVYSLGIVLYELLTSTRPYRLNVLSPAEMERTICERTPRAPSRAVCRPADDPPNRGAVDARQHVSQPQAHRAGAKKLQRTLRGDLDRIALKALHKDRTRRYQSPDALADDIQRYLQGRPVLAQPDSIAYRAKKFIRRNRWGVAAAGLILLSVLGGVAATGVALRTAIRHQNLATERLALSQRAVYNLELARVGGLWAREPRQARKLLENPAFCPPASREFTWGLYHRVCEPTKAILRGHTDAVHCVATPREELLASGSRDGTIRLWDARSYTELAVLTGHSSWVNSLAFSPDGKTLASASRDQTIKLWSVTDRRAIATLAGHADMVDCVVFSPDGKLLASASADGSIKLWDTASWRALDKPMRHDERVRCLAFSPDGSTLASGGQDQLIKLWDVPTGRLKDSIAFHAQAGLFRGSVLGLAFSPDGRTLASCGTHETLFLWDLGTGRRTELQGRTRRGHTREISAVAFAPDGKTLASASYDKTVRLWDIPLGEEKARLEGHTDFVRSLAFFSDGRSLVSAGNDRTIRVWHVRREPLSKRLAGHSGPVFGVAFSPDGRTVASAGEDKTVRLWDVRTGACLSSLVGHRAAVRSVAFSPRGGILASGGYDNTVRVWDRFSNKGLAVLEGHRDRVQTLAFSPSGLVLASGSRDQTIKLWQVGTGRELATLEGHSGRITSLVFSPDGTLVASGSHDSTIRIWDCSTGETERILRPGGPIGSVCFSPDGKTIAAGPARLSASGLCDGAMRLWDLATSDVRLEWHGHTDEVFWIEYSPDGKTLASAAADSTVKLWDPITGQERATLRSQNHWVHCVDFSPDGRRLASCGEDIAIWASDDWSSSSVAVAREGPVKRAPAAPPQLKAESRRIHPLSRRFALQRGNDECYSIVLSQDDTLIASLDQHQVVVWDATAGTKMLTLPGYDDQVCSVGFSRDGSQLALGRIDGTIEIRQLRGGALVAELTYRRREPCGVVFSPDANLLAAWSSAGPVVIWNTDTLERIGELPASENASLSGGIVFAPQGGLLASGTVSGSVSLWNAAALTEAMLLKRHFGIIACLAFSRDGRLVASGSYDLDQPVIIWNTQTRQPVSTLRGHPDFVTSVAFSPDGTMLMSATGGYDDTVRLWDVRSGRMITVLSDCPVETSFLRWSSDGTMLATKGVRPEIDVWDVDLRLLHDLAHRDTAE